MPVVFAHDIVGMPTPFSSTAKFHGLLGRDFLSHFRFTYDGPAGTFDLEIPPQQVGPGQKEAEQQMSRQERRRLERERKGK